MTIRALRDHGSIVVLVLGCSGAACGSGAPGGASSGASGSGAVMAVGGALSAGGTATAGVAANAGSSNGSFGGASSGGAQTVSSAGGSPAGASNGGASSGGTGGRAMGGSAGAPAGGSGGAAVSACSDTGTLGASSLAVRFANAVIARWPDPGNINGGTPAWEYNVGIVLHGMERVYGGTKDARYLTYIRKYVDEFVDDQGVVNRPAAHSFDTIQPAILLPFLWQKTNAAKYRTAAQNMRNLYDSIPKNSAGGFWHKQTYPNQMWLDSIYMGETFLSRYGAVFSCGAFCNDTTVMQTKLIADHVRDPATGLLYHAWDASLAASWADASTGRSPVIWGRALGWYAMSLVDLLADLPEAQSGRSDLLLILNTLAAGLVTAQDPTTGLWFQVLDKGAMSGNWSEASASGMFVYALKVAADRGYIAASYAAAADRGWQGLMTEVTQDATGPVINNAVQGMGVQDNYANYVNKSRLMNSSHGLCAILLAASVMEASCP